MSTTGTLETGFTARCGTCKKDFDDEAADTIQELTADMVKAGWQLFPTCCAKCVKELGIWYTDDRTKTSDPVLCGVHPKDFGDYRTCMLPAQHLGQHEYPAKPTKKASGDDTGPVRRRMRRRLL